MKTVHSILRTSFQEGVLKTQLINLHYITYIYELICFLHHQVFFVS